MEVEERGSRGQSGHLRAGRNGEKDWKTGGNSRETGGLRVAGGTVQWKCGGQFCIRTRCRAMWESVGWQKMGCSLRNAASSRATDASVHLFQGLTPRRGTIVHHHNNSPHFLRPLPVVQNAKNYHRRASEPSPARRPTTAMTTCSDAIPFSFLEMRLRIRMACTVLSHSTQVDEFNLPTSLVTRNLTNFLMMGFRL